MDTHLHVSFAETIRKVGRTDATPDSPNPADAPVDGCLLPLPPRTTSSDFGAGFADGELGCKRQFVIGVAAQSCTALT